MIEQDQLSRGVLVDQAIRTLQHSLAEAPDAYRLLRTAWEWLSSHTGADVLGVATLGPPEPVGYLFSEDPLEAGTREGVWRELVAMAQQATPEPGMYPRRASDRRAWSVSHAHPMVLENPATLGPWVVRAAGKPSAIVTGWRFAPLPPTETIIRMMPDVATLIALYLRNLQWFDIQPEEQPAEAMTFEELLETEVSQASRKRVPLSLALIEYSVCNGKSGSGYLTPELCDEIAHVVKATARKGDHVVPISDSCLAVIMPKTDARGALIGADRFQTELHRYFSGRKPRLAIRIGVGGRDPEETLASELFARASEALADARATGVATAFLHV